ncbi:autotransporter outer membrane beta-barrel domain-containing protein [Budvicia aquatica]|uniref:autotransporter outer membrane beta-barrel domain-containing protein n=1 Tax=Budvicia aquatica TaxID=82979 RepID=UPI00106A3440|nr:autotransporter outer membrane beta-barrel domain-containing protein [Budvicia aquatica]
MRGAAARYAGIIGLINTAINTTGDNSTGIISDGDSSYVKAENTNITMAGQKSVGVLANAGGKVDLKNNTISLTDLGTNGSGLTASGVGSNISAINAIINVKGSGTNGGNAPVGVGAENGGLVTLTGGSVTMEGTNRTIAARAGNNSNIIATGTRFTTNGNNSHAVMAWLNDPTTIGTVTLTDATISTAGINSYGITSNNQGAEITASNTNITTSGNVGRGVYAWNGGTVALNGGSITTGGDIASGLQAAGVGADSAAQSAKIDALNVNVTTRGKNSDGVTAGWDDGSQGIVNFTGGSITTSGELSAGVAARYAGNIRLINTTINASGINSSAASADSGGVLNINNTSLTSQKSSGIALTNNATVALNNSTVTANGASISSTLNQAGQTQNITVGLGSKLNVNNGTLLQVNRTAEGMDGIVNLTLGIGSSARGDISDLNGLNANGTRSAGGKTNFIVQKGADWLGSVSGINDITIGNGSSFVNTGNAPIMGNLRALQNARLQFLNSTTIQGSLDLKEQSNTIFNQNAIIFQNLMAQAASIQFMAMSHIQQSIIAANNSMISFINSARIDADLTGDSSSFAFSQQSDAINRILGNIALSNNSKIKGGTLLNPIIIGGNVDASGGSVLGGNLLVSGALSGTGGTLSPGNSVGTQTYASMAGFSGNYVAEVNSAGLSDKVIIQGNADISAINLSVAQENGNGGYQLNHAYTILQTTNGGTVQNSFASTALDTSFQNTLVKLDPVNYGTDNVQVSLSVDQQKLADKQGDLTSNQRNTLNGDLGAVGQNSAVDAAMLSTDTAKALDQLSGEVHSSLRSSLLASSTMLTDIVNDRARTNAKTNRNENYVWVQALGGSYSLNGDGNTAKSTNKNWGIAVGGAMALQDGWQLGMAAAYNNEDIDVDSRSSSADVDTTSLLAYVSNSWSAGLGNVNLLAGGGYSWHNIDTQRDVSLVNQNITSSYNANTTQLFTDLGYEIPVIDSFTVEPYTGIGWYRQKTNDFTEHGGSAALRGQGDTQDVTTYNLGVRSKLAFAMGNTPASVNMSAGWRHAAGDIDSDVRLNLAQGQGSAYTVTGAPLSKDAAVLAFGVEAEVVKNAVVGVSYNGQVASDNSSNAGTLYMKYTF